MTTRAAEPTKTEIFRSLVRVQEQYAAAKRAADAARAVYEKKYAQSVSEAAPIMRTGQMAVFLDRDRQRDKLWRAYRDAQGEADRLEQLLIRLKRSFAEAR